MARAPNENADKAYKLFQSGMKLVEIASQLNIPPGTVRRWKSTYKWDSERSDKNNERSHKKGAPKSNKNAVGNKGGAAPAENKNAEKHGFFSKWLPEETAEIMKSIQKLDPLDILWDNIQLQYTAIIRAQRLMYVKDQQDVTTTKIGDGYSETGGSEKWEVQQAWDKHATFLNAQSRAMKTLEGMIKQYDELLHKNWELATEEQKQRINKLKVDIAKSKEDETETTEDDGFIDALSGKVDGLWQEE